ncbi:hypothetical protein [Aminobacter sp. DSM 101952]|nr:hypothetical protein [Aminobacter sp. DSM 101952]
MRVTFAEKVHMLAFRSRSPGRPAAADRRLRWTLKAMRRVG